MVAVHCPRWRPCPYMVKISKSLILQNRACFWLNLCINHPLNNWPTWIKENCVQHLFRTYSSLRNIGRFWSFCFHCLSILLCGSNMCTQTSSPVSKLEITWLLQPLYVFKSSRAHLRHCVFCSSVCKWGTHLAQTFPRSKCFSELFAHCLLICQYN